MAGVDKWRNKRLSLVAKVKTKEGELVGFVERPSLRRMMLGKGTVYLYVKTDRGRVNTIYDKRAYKAPYLELEKITDKKAARRFKTLA